MRGTFRVAHAQILTGNGCRVPHQSNRRPRDQRKQLGISDRVGGLRRGAVLQRSDETQQQHAGDVHRDPLHTGRKAEAEQRPDDREVWPPIDTGMEVDHRARCEEPPGTVAGDDRAARDGAERGADRPQERDEQHIEDHRQHRHRDAQPQRRPWVAGSAERTAQHEEHHHAEDAHEHRAQEGKGFGLHLRRGVDDVEQPRRGRVADRGQQHRKGERGKKRLVDDAVHLLRLVRPGEAGHEHGHAGEQRAQKDDDNDDDLPADADGGIAGIADEMANHGLIDDSLEAGDDVLQHRRPRQTPDGATNGAFDDGPVKCLPRRGRGVGHP